MRASRSSSKSASKSKQEQKRLNRGALVGSRGNEKESPRDVQTDLLANLDDESWILERLKQQGVDVYASAGSEGSMRDWLMQAIVDNQFGPVIAGRLDGKPESYAQLFERLYSVKLVNQNRHGARS